MAIDIGKARKILNETFLDNNENISEDEAATLIVKAEQQKKSLQEEMDNHERLNAAKQIVKDLQSSFTSAIRYEDAKIQFLLAKIEEIQSGEVNKNASV